MLYMPHFFTTLFYFLLLSRAVVSQWTATNDFHPALHPLAVRTPHLNCWISSYPTTDSLGSLPTFWNEGHATCGWAGLVLVDGEPYRWLGEGNETRTTAIHSEITPTRSIFTIPVLDSGVQLRVTFLSPIEPSDLSLQSLPFVYLAIDVESTDGQSHDVEVYSDITGSWTTGSRGANHQIVWNTTETEKSIYHQVMRRDPQPMTQVNDYAEDGITFYGMRSQTRITWQTGADTDVREQFRSRSGALTKGEDTDFRGILERRPVFALAANLVNIRSTSEPVVWALGFVRDPVIRTANGNRSSHFWSKYESIGDAIDDFIVDFPAAHERAIALDDKIQREAEAISGEYRDLVSLAARQAMAGVELTISRGSDGEWNTSDVMMFMKDTGKSNRISPVEVMYASFPMFMYLNVSYGGYLLKPLLQHQAAFEKNLQYAKKELGVTYPMATGSSAIGTPSGVEASGDMLIMAWAHAKFSGDSSLINRYYDLLKKWADYLDTNAIQLTDQSVDDLDKSDLSNLALKGILGIRAMSAICQALNRNDEAVAYMDKSTDYAAHWTNLARSNRGHVVSQYNDTSSDALIYNLYSDVWLGFDLIDPQVYTELGQLYSTKRVTSTYGLPFDDDTKIVKSHWTLFTAACLNNTEARDRMIRMVHDRASFNNATGAFPTDYDVDSGDASSGPSLGETSSASPAQGAMFALLALNLTSQQVIVPEDSEEATSSNSGMSGGVIAAIVVGVIIGVSIPILLGILLCRRRRQKRRRHHISIDSPSIVPFAGEISANNTPDSSRLKPTNTTPGPAPSQTSRLDEKGRIVLSAPSTANSSGDIIPSQDAATSGPATHLLRAEIDGLRRQMEEIRAAREYDLIPPPQYN